MSNLSQLMNEYFEGLKVQAAKFDQESKKIIESKKKPKHLEVLFNSVPLEEINDYLTNPNIDGYDDYIKFILFKNVILDDDYTNNVKLGKTSLNNDSKRIDEMYHQFIKDDSAVDNAFKKVIESNKNSNYHSHVMDNYYNQEKSFLKVYADLDYNRFFNDLFHIKNADNKITKNVLHSLKIDKKIYSIASLMESMMIKNTPHYFQITEQLHH